MYVVVPFFTHCYCFVDFFPLLLSLFAVFHGIRRICVARLSDGWVRLFSLLFFSSVLEVKKEKKKYSLRVRENESKCNRRRRGRPS